MSFLGAATCANAQLLNGTLDTTFYGSPLYVQTVNTGFGNSPGGGDATNGSELDAVYAKISGGNLYLFIAGCFQNNGNHLNVFIAGGDPGQNTLNVNPSTEAAMNGSIFAAGFNATYMIDGNDSGGTFYVDGFPLPDGSQATQVYLGPVPLTGGIGSATFGSTTFALNNTLTSTMGGANTNLSGSNVGASVTTGLEIVIPTSAIGYAGGSVNVLIDINGGGNGFLSNQFLPGLPVPSSNLGGSTFNFGPAPTPTNYITFQLDMSEQVAFGNFTNNFVDPSNPSNTNSVAVGGSFNGFGTGFQLTNDPSLLGFASNIYSGTFPIPGFLPLTNTFKFRVNNLDNGYELPLSTGGGNRTLIITNMNQVVPKLFYDDEGLGDLVVAPTSVQFSLYITNQTPIGTDGSFFTTGVDQPYVNGPWHGYDWGLGQGVPLIQVGSSDVYTNSFIFPRGSSLQVTYKYSADGPDNENGMGTNHIRYIRTYNSTYAFPQDVWSSTLGNIPYPNPGISSTNIVEPSFGYLTIAAPAVGVYPITWLGRPGVFLQNNSSLSGAWTTLSGTDGTQSTNMPGAGSVQFFRLLKP